MLFTCLQGSSLLWAKDIILLPSIVPFLILEANPSILLCTKQHFIMGPQVLESSMQPQGTPENGYSWQRVNSQLSSPSQPYSLREALAQAQSSRIGASAQALRESLHPILRQKLVWFLYTFMFV